MPDGRKTVPDQIANKMMVFQNQEAKVVKNGCFSFFKVI
jgi:hypothetical protein